MEETFLEDCPSRYYWWDGEAEGDCELDKGHEGKHKDAVFDWEDGDDGTWDQ